MQKAIWCLPLIFLALFGGRVQEINVVRPTEEDTRRVLELSETFERRMRETRDVGSLKELFISDFMRLHFEEEKTWGPPLVTSLPVTIQRHLVKQVTREEWERFYVAEVNLRYYFVLLLASRTKRGEIEKSNRDFSKKLFTPEVLTVLRSDPFLRDQYGNGDNQNTTIRTLNELRSLIATFEQATRMLREDFLKHPPERTGTYKENLRPPSNKRAIKARAGRSGYVSFFAVREPRLGFPPGTPFYHTRTSDSLFELWMVKTDKGMRLVWARVYPFN